MNSEHMLSAMGDDFTEWLAEAENFFEECVGGYFRLLEADKESDPAYEKLSEDDKFLLICEISDWTIEAYFDGAKIATGIGQGFGATIGSAIRYTIWDLAEKNPEVKRSFVVIGEYDHKRWPVLVISIDEDDRFVILGLLDQS